MSPSSECPIVVLASACAVVVPASSDSVSLKSLVQHCRSRGLSRYKYPEHLVIVDALPRNQFGKVIKKDLRETFG
jgi:non-ribosomal peptide synthetase component E (peptide arylation enzyme)